MTWGLTVACAALAVAHLLLVVPRLPPPEREEDDPPADYPTLVTPTNTALLAVGVLLAAQVLHLVPTPQLPPWLAFLGAGGALVLVDLRTTYLPRALNHLCLAQLAVGLGVTALFDWRAALAGAAGGLAAFALFHVAWWVGHFGYGDVRLAGIVGAVAGMQGATSWALTFVCGTTVGALWGVLHALDRRRTGAPEHFAYGPSLWLGPVLATAWLAV